MFHSDSTFGKQESKQDLSISPAYLYAFSYSANISSLDTDLESYYTQHSRNQLNFTTFRVWSAYRLWFQKSFISFLVYKWKAL